MSMNIIKSFFVSLLFIPVMVFAQAQGALPGAGLTPESSFYFLDRLGETLREFFTFSSEGKARLQITFAAERVAEIKVILETKGVEAKGLEIAESRLRAHLAKAAGIVENEKSKGKDVSKLAKELDDEFEAPKSAFEQAFKEQKRALEILKKDIKNQLHEARLFGNTDQVEALEKQLSEVKAQKELLEFKEDEQEEALEKEEERIEEEMEIKEEAEKAIKEAEEEKQEVINEAAEEGVNIPADTFTKFDKLLVQAKELFEKENYVGAKQLAKQAEKSLDKIDEAIEELDEAREDEEELNEEKEEKEREAKEEEEKETREEAKKEAKRLEEERKKAAEEIRKAEEELRKAGDEDND